jgi:hypothetical protein
MQAAMKASSFQNESRTLRTRAPSTSMAIRRRNAIRAFTCSGSNSPSRLAAFANDGLDAGHAPAGIALMAGKVVSLLDAWASSPRGV